ncbi:MAG: glycoside hydrolase family 3 N-terminal domain-containing protein, partial [Kiritimatiellia bacterium]
MKPTYRQQRLATRERVEDLIARMTLEEKAAQLGSVYCKDLVVRGRFSAAKAGKLLRYGIGQIARAGGMQGVNGTQAAQIVRDLQRFLIEHTRLGIPAIVHEECLSGFMAPGATTFPQAIGLASTWNPQLVESITAVIRRQIRSIGSVQGLAPVLDVARDPRWGRTEETFGEEPYLVASIGCAYIRGLQGGSLRSGVIATAKHFVAHGVPEGGRNLGPVHVGPRELREVYLFPFESAIRAAGARSIMNAYHELDGLPCAASRKLLTDTLRGEWGFAGFVVSDYGAIEMLQNFHRVAHDLGEAAVQAIEAGIDVELPRSVCYGPPLLQAVRMGRVGLATIDEAVRRVLWAKFELGLFEEPLPRTRVALNSWDKPAERRLAREAAEQSIVLLTNPRNLLPFRADRLRRLAVVGPNANSARNLFGDYGYTAHVTEDNPLRVVTVLEALQHKLGSRTEVVFAEGCEISGSDRTGIAEAARIASAADAVVAVLGERAGLRTGDLSGEGRDRSSLALPGVQAELLKALCDTGRPVVLVLVNGRPLALGDAVARCAAIVEAWYPGEEGGNAIANVLFGHACPSGKLPIAFPLDAGQIPVYYARHPSAFGPYVDDGFFPAEKTGPKPLFPFGHGLSYTTFRYSRLRISPARVEKAETVTVSCRVSNSGERPGVEVVQLYVRDDVASMERPVKELKGYARIALGPGETKQVTFLLALDQLGFYDQQMRFVVEPGTFTVMVGSSSEDIRLTGTFELKG